MSVTIPIPSLVLILAVAFVAGMFFGDRLPKMPKDVDDLG